jgi:hypothetical protein
MKYLYFILALFLSFQLSAHSWHVKPSYNRYGTRPGGNGSEANAWDLQTALSNKKLVIKPGDTVWVHGGVYWGHWDTVEANGGRIVAPLLYISYLKGSVHKPIVVKAYPGERAVVTGDSIFGENFYKKLCPACVTARLQPPIIAIKVSGKNTWFWGLEFTSNFHLRESYTPGEGAPNIKEGTAIYVNDCDSIKLINLHVHDIPGLGIAGYTGARNIEVYGCLSYFNGFSDISPSGTGGNGYRKNGSGIYMQNDSTAAKPSIKIIEDNIVFDNFSLGFEIYGSKNAHVNHFRIIDNIVFNNGAPGNSYQKNVLVGGGMKTYDNRLIGNVLVAGDGTNLAIGFKNGVENVNTLVKDNYIIGGSFDLMNATGMTFENNLLLGMGCINFYYRLCPLPEELIHPKYDFRNNIFYHPYPKGTFYHSVTQCDNGRWECYSGLESDLEYKNYNVDAILGNGGGNILSRTMPHPQDIKIRENRYEPGTAEVVVLDWDTSKQVSLSLDKYIPKGNAYQLTDVQNIKAGPVLKGQYNGKAVVTIGDKMQVPVGFGDTINHYMVMPKHTPAVMTAYLLKYFPYTIKLVQKKRILEAEFYNASGQSVKPEDVFKYTWKYNGKTIEASGGPQIKLKEAGDYTLEVTMQNMMTGDATQKVKL